MREGRREGETKREREREVHVDKTGVIIMHKYFHIR